MRLCRHAEEVQETFKILLATDGSESALLAARFLGRILPESGAELTLLCVVMPACDNKDLAWLPIVEISREMAARVQERSPQLVFEKTLDALGARRPRLLFAVSRGQPATSICQAVEEGHYDLVVLGKSRRRRFGGDIGETVCRRSSCPVLIVT